MTSVCLGCGTSIRKHCRNIYCIVASQHLEDSLTNLANTETFITHATASVACLLPNIATITKPQSTFLMNSSLFW